MPVPANYKGDLKGGPNSWQQPRAIPTIGSVWGLNLPIELFLFFLSLHLKNKTNQTAKYATQRQYKTKTEKISDKRIDKQLTSTLVKN